MKQIQRIVPMLLALAGAFFCVAAAIPAFKGEGLNATFFILGGLFLVIAFAMKRKPTSN